MSSSLISRSDRLRLDSVRSAQDLRARWNQADVLMVPQKRNDRYAIGFACSDRCVEESLRLRYEVFNLELGEGLAESHLTGMDRDPFDDQMTHLVLLDRESDRIVGTYRLQTMREAMRGLGSYSALEFDLSPMRPYLAKSVECGRVCIAPAHRSLATLHLLWAGIGAFIRLHSQVLLFGCCSINTTNPEDGWRALETIRRKKFLHPELFVKAQPNYSCKQVERGTIATAEKPLGIPPLFAAYARMGAKVVSGPAIDRDFGTVDFLVLLNSADVDWSYFGISD